VLDRAGQVYSSSGVLTGPQVIQPGIIPPPPGFRPGELIDFSKLGPFENVVVSELSGAFIDLETVGSGFEFTGGPGGGGGGNILDALCRFITTENLTGLLALYADDFEDAQGHDKQELMENWRSFFDYFKVNGCRIPNASLSVSVDPQVQNGFIINGSMEIFTLNPSIHVVAPPDDPTALEEEQERDSILGSEVGIIIGQEGPIIFDQIVPFYEIGDGRGWHMDIIDDDHVEERLDPADRVLTQRYFYKTRRDRGKEGNGTVFLREEDSGNSRNGLYYAVFYEDIEPQSALDDGNPEGGWLQPVVVFQLFIEDEEDTSPSSIFRFPFNLKVEITDLATQAAQITGGEFATWGFLVSRTDADALEDTPIGQGEAIDALLVSAAGFRFFDPVGIQADPAFEGTYDSHLFEEDGFHVTDPLSSAYVVDLIQTASDVVDSGLPNLGLQLLDFITDPSLEIPPDFIQDLVPFFAFDHQTTADVEFIRGIYLITFRKDEFGDPNKLYYVVMQVMEGFPHVDSEEPDNNNTPSGNTIFRWRFDPETQFIPFNTFKSAQEKKADLKKVVEELKLKKVPTNSE